MTLIYQITSADAIAWIGITAVCVFVVYAIVSDIAFRKKMEKDPKEKK